jgi:hypothetical protein
MIFKLISALMIEESVIATIKLKLVQSRLMGQSWRITLRITHAKSAGGMEQITLGPRKLVR